MVDGLLADIGTGAVLPIRSSLLATGRPLLTCGTWIRRVRNSLVTCLWWIEHRSSIAKNDSLCLRQVPCIKWHASVAAQHRPRTWNDCLWTGNVRNFSTVIRFYMLTFSWIIHAILPLLQLLYWWSELLCCIMLFSQFLYREFVNSQFLSSLQFSHFMSTCDLSISKCSLSLSWPVLPVVELALFEILHIRNVHPPIPTAENKFAAEVHNASVQRFHFAFLLHEFRYRFSKQVISVPKKKRFRNICWVRESEVRFVAPKTSWCLKGKSSLSENVSWFNLFLLENNATGRFPCTYLILRWTGHQVFSFSVINLRSFCICFSLL